MTPHHTYKESTMRRIYTKVRQIMTEMDRPASAADISAALSKRTKLYQLSPTSIGIFLSRADWVEIVDRGTRKNSISSDVRLYALRPDAEDTR